MDFGRQINSIAGGAGYRGRPTAGAQFAVHRLAGPAISAKGNNKIRSKTLR
jgi:hypothetical protein